MALLFWEGLDSVQVGAYDMFTHIPNFVPTWETHQGAAAGIGYVQTSGGRFNGGYMTNAGNGAYWGRIYLPTSPSEVYHGRAWLPYSNQYSLLGFWGNHNNNNGYMNTNGCPAPDVWLETKQGGYIRAYSSLNGCSYGTSVGGYGGGVLIGESAPGSFKFNVWNFIEVRCKMSSSNVNNDGIVQVWVNNLLVLSNTACCTKVSNTATGYFGTTVGPNASNHSDDYYVLDTTGPAPWNTRLGDVRITTLVPNTDVGANSGTPSTGTTHWGVLDENPYNTSDYLSIPNVVGNTERFYHTRLPTPAANVFAINLGLFALKSDAGTANIRAILVNNSSGYYVNSNTTVLTTNYVRSLNQFSTNPETGNQWTNAELDNAQIGVVVVA